MKRALLLTLTLAVAAISSHALAQVPPVAEPALVPSTAPVPETASPAGTTPVVPPVAGLPPAGPPAETTPIQPAPTPPVVPAARPPAVTPLPPSALPPTIPGPGATTPLATGFPQLGLFSGTQGEAGFGGNSRYITSQNVAITWSEGKDEAWAYSKSLGRWAKQSLDPPATKAHEVPILTNNLVVWSTGTAIYGFSGTLGRWSKQSLDPPATNERPALSEGVAVLQIGTTFYGFSGLMGRWDVLKLPADSKATFAVDDEYALVTDREGLYTFSAATGRWSSPQDSTPQIGDATVSDASGTSGASEVRMFQLKHANAVTLESTILRQLFADELRLGANHTGMGDTIIARGKPEALDQLEALLKVLDRPARSATGSRSAGSMGSGYEGDMGAGDAMMMEGMSGMPGGMPAGPASRAQLLRTYEQAEQRAADLAKQLRENRPRSGSGQSPAALEQAVAQAFAARQRLHQHDLAALENRLQSTRETLSMRERIKQQIIERRVSDLLNPNLKWDAPPTAAATAPPASTSVESPSNPQGLLALQAQTGRFHKLQERWNLMFELYKGGRVDIGEALRAAAEVYEAEAAIANSPATGVQAAERHVERTRGLQEIVDAKFRSEVEPVQAKLAAEAAVLNAEAILATAQDTANRLSTQPATPLVPAGAMNDVPTALQFASDLRGTWLQVAQERNGERTDVKPGTVFMLTFDGNRYTLRQGAEAYASGTFKVGNDVVDGRELDTVRTWLKGETEETQRPQRELGLVNVFRDRLLWCYGGVRTNERPDRFRTAKDDGRLLTEWRRITFEPLSDDQLRSVDLGRLATLATSIKPRSARITQRVFPEGKVSDSAEESELAAGEMVIHLRGLDGALLRFRNGNVPLKASMPIQTSSGATMKFIVPSQHTGGGLWLNGALRAYNESPRTALFVARGPVDVLATAEDIDQAAAGNTVVKVIYLPREGDGSNVESLVSTRLEPGVDPVEEAKKRGDLLIVLTLAISDLSAEGADAAAGPVPKAVQVRLTGLGGATSTNSAPGSEPVTLSKTSDLSIRPGYAISLMLSKIPGRGQLQLSAHLAVPALSARASQWAAHNNIPLQIASEDLDKAAADGSVVMAAYLPNGTNEQAYPALVSTRQSPGIDAVEEAKKRGDVLVALTLSNVVSSAEDGDRADLPPAAVRLPTSAQSAETSRIPAGDSPLILARPEEFQQRLSELHHKVATAQRIVDDHKGNAAAGNPQPQRFVDNALADLRSWQNKLDLAMAEYAAQVKLLESNLQSAEAAVEAAVKNRDRVTKLFDRDASTAAELDEAQLKSSEAKSRVERAKTLLELYRQVDALSRPAAESDPADSKPDQPPAPAKE